MREPTTYLRKLGVPTNIHPRQCAGSRLCARHVSEQRRQDEQVCKKASASYLKHIMYALWKLSKLYSGRWTGAS
jgi:hypothetical protein